MRTIRPAVRVAFALIAANAVLGSCSSSSRMVNMWKDPAYPAAPIDNALVVSISKNEVWRRVWEDAIVEELKSNGVTATPSYSLFPSAVPDTQQVIDAVRSSGYAGVVVSRHLDVREVTHFVPGYLASVPVYSYGYWGRYYHPHYVTVYRPGYAVTGTEVRYQIDVWSAEEGGKLVWMGTTASLNPSSYDQIRDEVSRLLVQELRMTGVIEGRGL